MVTSTSAGTVVRSYTKHSRISSNHLSLCSGLFSNAKKIALKLAEK
jgi:hypothetical protein